jgi:hypothetical protein
MKMSNYNNNDFLHNQLTVPATLINGVFSTSRFFETSPKGEFLRYLLSKNEGCLSLIDRSVDLLNTTLQAFPAPGSLQEWSLVDDQRNKHLSVNNCSYSRIDKKRTSNQQNNKMLGSYSFLLGSLPRNAVSLIYEFAHNIHSTYFYIYFTLADGFNVPSEWIDKNIKLELDFNLYTHMDMIDELKEKYCHHGNTNYLVSQLDNYLDFSFEQKNHEDYDTLYDNMNYDLKFPWLNLSEPKMYTTYNPHNYFNVMDLQSDEFSVFNMDSWNAFFDTGVVSNILKKHDNITKLIEDIACLCYGVSMCRNKKDIAFICINFLKLRCGDSSLLYKTAGCVEDIMTRVTDTFIGEESLTSDDEALEESILRDLELQSDFLDKSRTLLSLYQSIRFGPLFKRCQKLLTYMIAFSLFKPFGYDLKSAGYTALEKEVIERKCWNSDEGIFHILETLQFLCERGHACLKTGSLDALFLSGSSFDTFYLDCQKIKKWHPTIGHPELMKLEKITEHAFLAALESAIERGESIYKYSKGDKMDKKQVSQMLNDLHSIRTHHLTIAYALKDRKSPFTVLIFGDTGIGKSTFQNILFTHFGLRRNQPLGDEFKYVKNPVSKYWDNFRTNMWCLIQDDIGFLKTSIAASGDPSCMETIQICNNVAFTPDQASLDLKGKMPMRCELVIGSTNTKTLNAYSYFSCPSAFQRRYKYVITLTLKDEYKNEQGMLNTHDLPLNEEGTYPDYWWFDIEYIAPRSVHDNANSKNCAEMKMLHQRLGMKDFLKWYNTAIDRHYSEQDQTASSTENIKKTQLCEVCRLPSGMCECSLQNESYGDYQFILNSIIWIIRMYVLLKYICLPCFDKLYLSYQRLSTVTWPLYFSAFYCKVMAAKFAPQWCIDAYTKFTYTREYYYEAFIRKYPRDYWRTLGVETAYKMSNPPFLTNVACILGALFIAFKVFKTEKKVKEVEEKISPKFQADINVGSVPVASKEEPNNVWYNDKFELHQMDVGKLSVGWNGLDDDQILKKLSLNCVYFTIKTGLTKGRRTSAFCVSGQIYMFNSHFLRDLEGNVELTVGFQDGKQGVNPNITVIISTSRVFKKPNSDISLLEIRGLPPRANYIDLFPNETFDCKNEGYLLRRAFDGSITARNMKRIRQCKNVYERNIDATIDMWTGVCPSGAEYGDCGSILVVRTGFGPSILGIHFLGSTFISNVASEKVTREFLESAIQTMTRFNVQDTGLIVDAPSVPVAVVDLHKKSAFRYIDQGSAQVVGSLTLPRAHGKSRVENTPMNEYLSNKGYNTNYMAPDLVSWRPWHLAAKEMVNPANKFEPDILIKCKDAFVKDILSAIPQSILKEQVQVYDDFTAINGAAGVTYVDKINRNTSMGHPYNRSKRFYIEAIPARGENLDPVKFSNEIEKQMLRIEEDYRKGIRSNAIFRGNLKDEAVAELKAKLGKTRVFAGAPVAWSIVNRKYTLSFIRLLQSNQYIFECACGIVCQSPEWEVLKMYLTHHGSDRLVAGDFSKFDKRMCAEIIQLAFDIIIAVCEASGNYSEQDLLVIAGIGKDTAFAWMNFNGDLVSFFGSNPSGHPLTVIINSLVNSLYMRYCFSKLTNRDPQDFKKYVNLMTYGDDNIMNVSSETPEFNHTAIQSCLKNVGIGYTMADKEADSIPYIHIDACSFLKRTWRYDSDFGMHVAPLDSDSIEKMLMTWVRSKTISAQEQCIAVISSAVMEYAFYGREIFENRCTLLKKMCLDLDLDLYVEPSTFPTFRELINRFHMSGHKSRGAEASVKHLNV